MGFLIFGIFYYFRLPWGLPMVAGGISDFCSFLLFSLCPEVSCGISDFWIFFDCPEVCFDFWNFLLFSIASGSAHGVRWDFWSGTSERKFGINLLAPPLVCE